MLVKDIFLGGGSVGGRSRSGGPRGSFNSVSIFEWHLCKGGAVLLPFLVFLIAGEVLKGPTMCVHIWVILKEMC